MINCAHPTHFDAVLAGGGSWLGRIRGVRANASRRSHAELNEAPDLDSGDPAELGAQYAELMDVLPHFNVMGGCCGTDERHLEQIAESCAPKFRAR
jgi:S-methylmethionine-dependent homocysteine/selenocysteine methylase